VRFAARTDANHSAIVGALRACGAEVLSLAAVGKGCPDLLIWHPATQRMQLVEVKDGRRPPSERRLTPDQEAFHKRWPVTVVLDIEGAVAALVSAQTLATAHSR